MLIGMVLSWGQEEAVLIQFPCHLHMEITNLQVTLLSSTHMLFNMLSGLLGK